METVKQKTNHVKRLLETEKQQLEKILNNWPNGYDTEKKQRINWLDDVTEVLNSLN